MSFFIKLIKKFFEKIKQIFGEKEKPILKNPKPDDVWLVSFPKAGNTWMNFLLANIMIKYCKKNIDINFKTIYSVVPDIHYNKEEISNDSEFAPFPRIIKSHSEFLSDYRRVVYILRDPRDIMVSYYHYLSKKNNGPKFKTFSEFIKNKKYGLSACLEHIKGWLEKWHILIRYEDLKENPKEQLNRILSFLKISVDNDILEFAIKKSSFGSMQSLEKRDKIVKAGDFRKDFAFMRKGQIGGWKELFTEDDSRYYKSQVEKYKLSNFLKENNYS